jgi:hypothetical protein
MNDRFAYDASLLSNEELNNRVAIREKYLPETTEAAVAELQSRGRVFSDEELDIIQQDLIAQRENAELSGKSSGAFSQTYNNVVVEDPAAPQLYSRKAIYLFTFFFGALFGSIMLAINSRKVNNSKGVLLALAFGIPVTILQIIAAEYIKASASSYGFFWGLVSAFIMDYVLWPRVIGTATFYRTKPIWVPLIIGLVFLALLVTAALMGQ